MTSFAAIQVSLGHSFVLHITQHRFLPLTQVKQAALHFLRPPYLYPREGEHGGQIPVSQNGCNSLDIPHPAHQLQK